MATTKLAAFHDVHTPERPRWASHHQTGHAPLVNTIGSATTNTYLRNPIKFLFVREWLKWC